jgi:hypothetical protein
MMVGKRFSVFGVSEVVSILEHGNYYHCGGEVIHAFATVTPHINVPVFMVWMGNDYHILDVGQECESLEVAVKIAEDWAAQHQTFIILRTTEGECI